jgi:predicted transcriptional regulator
MSKAVLISIRPKWVEKIASGEKTIEVRKTKPKLETPFKAYIYCTMPDAKDPHNILELHGADGKIRKANGKVIGEFTCDQTFPINVFDNGSIQNWLFEHMERSCLTYEELADYIGNGKTGYGWHISDLLIYDQPRELSEFQRATDPCDSCHAEYTWECTGCKKFSGDIKRPPQSWCYVEAVEDD